MCGTFQRAGFQVVDLGDLLSWASYLYPKGQSLWCRLGDIFIIVSTIVFLVENVQ